MSTLFSSVSAAYPTTSSISAGKFQFIHSREMNGSLLREVVHFLDTADTSHPFQFPQWVRSASGGFIAGSHFCTYRDNDRISWFASCSSFYPMGRLARPLKALVLTRGPICGDASTSRLALDDLSQYSRSRGFAFIDASPEMIPTSNPAAVEAFAREGWRPLAGTRTSLRLNLNKSEDEIIAGFRKTTRHEVQKAARIGVVVEHAQSDVELAAFLRIYTEMTARKGFQPDPIQHIRQTIRWLLNEPKRGTLLLARHRGRILGGAVIIRSGSRCWYVWGATERYEYASAGHILQWNAFLWAKKHRCTEYDFGGYTENATTGPALFKKGFGGEVVRFMKAQRLIVNNPRERVLHFLSGLRG
jgi:hypothetical protein